MGLPLGGALLLSAASRPSPVLVLMPPYRAFSCKLNRLVIKSPNLAEVVARVELKDGLPILTRLADGGSVAVNTSGMSDHIYSG